MLVEFHWLRAFQAIDILDQWHIVQENEKAGIYQGCVVHSETRIVFNSLRPSDAYMRR